MSSATEVMAPNDGPTEKMEVDGAMSKSAETGWSKFVECLRLLRTAYTSYEADEGIDPLKSEALVRKALRIALSYRRTLTPEVMDIILSRLFAGAQYLEPARLAMKSDEFGPIEEDKDIILEIQLYAHLLVLLHLINAGKHERAAKYSMNLVELLLVAAKNTHRPTVYPLFSKIYFYFTLAHDRIGRIGDVQEKLFIAFYMSWMKHDSNGQAMLICLILQCYLKTNQFLQASRFLSKTQFPNTSSNYIWARYCYYSARVMAVQLDYTGAYSQLMNSIRKSPQGEGKAVGFKVAVYKLFVLVQLLLGEIPSRSIFNIPELKKYLFPYFQLARCVRNGDLNSYTTILEYYEDAFIKDGNLSLAQRLRSSVLITGIRKIHKCYSRIGFEDVRLRLKLDTVEDVECVLAKAIDDGVIQGVLNHEEQYLQCEEQTDKYSSLEPQQAFHNRSIFCFNLREEILQRLRFPTDKNDEEKEKSEKNDDEEGQRDLTDELRDSETDEDDYF